ncbi:MAG: acyl-CoA dehydrogenase [Promethearchaeota archaeon]
MTILLDPHHHTRAYKDPESRDIMLKTIEFFETKGKTNLLDDDFNRVWYQDFLDFIKENKIFYHLLTPKQYGDELCRWDTWRNCEFNEILGFYGLHYWYTWQVSILGLGPIWISDNEAVKKKTAQLLKDGGIFAFGLSEKEHGADIYSTEMALKKQPDGTYKANGSKYYIGNGNKAGLVSVIGKMQNIGEVENEKYDRFVFFVVETDHPNYELVQNVIAVQSYVAEYKLNDYPITEAEILSKKRDAWDMALNTVNIGKFNLGFASIGICTHAFYEAINHASHRFLYGHYVTEFPHIQNFLSEAYCRLVAMKLFALRGADYMRVATPEDRRYLLYDPIVKMKVTSQGEEVIDLLWEIIAAKGFEKTMYFAMATRDIRALPKLEGTVHVNMALIIKFMQGYFLNPQEYPPVPKMDAVQNDGFLFNQGATKGLSKIRFHDYHIAYDKVDLPNVNIFKEQIAVFYDFLTKATPRESQGRDLDFLLISGELFTLVVYGQLILENVAANTISEDLVDQIFDFMVRDFAKFALKLYSKPSTSKRQSKYCLEMIRKPVKNKERVKRIWEAEILPLKDKYEMNP